MDLIALPAPPVTVMELPVPAVVEINLPVVAVSVLPAGFIPMVPEHTLFTAAGSGGAVVRASVRLIAATAGSGATTVRPSPRILAAASGVGVVSIPAYVVGQAFPTTIEASGEGTSTVRPAAGSAVAAASTGTTVIRPSVATTATATGVGQLAVAAAPAVAAGASGAGTSTVRPAAAVSAAAAGSGTATVTPITFTSAGLQKSGNQTVVSGTYTTVTGWAERSGFPFILESDGIRIPADLTVNFTYRVVWGATTPAGGSQEVQLTSDGVALTSTYQKNGQFSTAPIKSGTFVGTGGVVRMQARSNVGGSGATVTASTYLEITKP